MFSSRVPVDRRYDAVPPQSPRRRFGDRLLRTSLTASCDDHRQKHGRRHQVNRSSKLDSSPPETEITTRLPGRVENTTFISSSELAAALRRAAAAHGEHEKRTGQHDANWPDWYGEYIAREQAGEELPS